MNIHFVEKDPDAYVMFLGNSLKFFNVNANVKNVVEDIQAGVPESEVQSKNGINAETYSNICSTLNSEAVKTMTGVRDDTLYKLALNVTNVCNLNCRYCYAEGGSYASNESLMDTATAKMAIDLFYSKYERIEVIQFFGGEPLLNEPVIRFVCQYITEMYADGKINRIPIFGAVTNGTIYSDELADTIAKYKITLTISIDGAKEVHDNMRVHKNGDGSFDKIVENIKKYGEHSINIGGVESTYNASHVKHGYSVIDTVKFIKDELDIFSVHIVPVSSEEPTDYSLNDRDSFVDSVKEIFSEKINNKKSYEYAFVSRIVNLLKSKTANKYICEAGLSNFSVSAKGDIYPCFLFTDLQHFKMGNVYDGIGVFDSPEFVGLRESFLKFSKFEYEKCKNCFNNRVCSGCLGTNFFNCGDVFSTPDEDCEMRKALTEKVLIELSNLI